MNTLAHPSFRFVYDRNKRATETKPAPLVVELYFGRERRFLNIGIKLLPHQWTGQNIAMHRDAPQLNQRLNELRIEIQATIDKLYKHPQTFSLQALSEALTQKRKAQETSFIDFAYRRCTERGLRLSTQKQHEVAIRMLEESGVIKYFSDLTPSNILNFDAWLRSHEGRGLTHQYTIHGYHKRIKVYINEAVQFGHISESPYQRLKLPRGERSTIKYLKAKEVEIIRNTTIEDKALDRVRRLFVLQIYTGLSYSDMYAVDWANAEVRADGRYYIRQARVKTLEEYYLVLLPPAIEVLESFGWDLPPLSNQKYNAYLKGLGVACGIRLPLTSHIARHTFATTITLSNKVPIEIVAKMMGHSDIKTTQRYAKVLAEDVIDAFVDLEGKI